MVSTQAAMDRCGTGDRRRRRSRLAFTAGLLLGGIQGAVLLLAVLALRDPAGPPAAVSAGAGPQGPVRADLWMGRIQVSTRPASVRVADGDRAAEARLLPGWVARVYPGSHPARESLGDGDLGTFVVDETVFHLGLHRYHGIEGVREASYRLNAFYDAQVAGRHQLSVEVNFAGPTDGDAPRCQLTLAVADQPLLSRLVSFRNPGAERHTLTGAMDLAAGLHRADLQLRCDYVLDRRRVVEDQGALISVAVYTRQPGERTFRTRPFLYGVEFGDSVPSPRPTGPVPRTASGRLVADLPLTAPGLAPGVEAHVLSTHVKPMEIYR